ncbi:hypothetical protein RND81_11G144700 [Saponaria officinalis]|uniref:Uncharacterized protein n=1 Tax=Saponaria officinalis TaxID=3572 RepID=A0AAW1HM57_SAPOF
MTVGREIVSRTWRRKSRTRTRGHHTHRLPIRLHSGVFFPLPTHFLLHSLNRLSIRIALGLQSPQLLFKSRALTRELRCHGRYIRGCRMPTPVNRMFVQPPCHGLSSPEHHILPVKSPRNFIISSVLVQRRSVRGRLTHPLLVNGLKKRQIK